VVVFLFPGHGWLVDSFWTENRSFGAIARSCRQVSRRGRTAVISMMARCFEWCVFIVSTVRVRYY
jgi:hypothetical protein